jgi:hypothetical protein
MSGATMQTEDRTRSHAVLRVRRVQKLDTPTRELYLGAGSRNRTHDQRFTKPLLYQLSYAGCVCDFTRASAAGVTIDWKASTLTFKNKGQIPGAPG